MIYLTVFIWLLIVCMIIVHLYYVILYYLPSRYLEYGSIDRLSDVFPPVLYLKEALPDISIGTTCKQCSCKEEKCIGPEVLIFNLFSLEVRLTYTKLLEL